MTLDLFKALVRPVSVIAVITIVTIIPAFAGLLDAIIPGAGERFAAAFTGFLSAVPIGFWTFAGLVVTGYTAARTVDKYRQNGNGE